MSTHNRSFYGEIRKVFTLYPLLSRPKFTLSIWTSPFAYLIMCLEITALVANISDTDQMPHSAASNYLDKYGVLV